MKKVLLVIVSLIGFATAKAYDYPYLTFQNADGTEQSVSVEGLTITYADGQLSIVGNGVTQKLDAAQLSKMYFATEASSIETLNRDNDGRVEIYSVFGIFLGNYDSAQQAVSALEKGVYVMKSASETHKIIVR